MGERLEKGQKIKAVLSKSFEIVMPEEVELFLHDSREYFRIRRSNEQ